MAEAASKELVRRFFEEILNAQNAAALKAIVAEDFVTHHPSSPHPLVGREALMEFVGGFHRGFPDLRYDVAQLIAEDDLVAARWVATGTHRGPFMGIAATGKQVTVAGTDVFRVADGQCRESWVSSDMLGLMVQLGVVQLPG